MPKLEASSTGQDASNSDSYPENPDLNHFGDVHLDSTFTDLDVSSFNAESPNRQESARTSFESFLKRCRVSTGEKVNDFAEPPYRIPKRMPGLKTTYQ